MGCELISVGLACADVLVRPVDELPKRGTLGLVPGMEMHLGGLAAVTAVNYRRLGGTVAYVGKLGLDGFGSYIHQFMSENGVQMDAVARVRGLTSAATVALVNSDGERTFLHCSGASAQFGEDDIPLESFRDARLLHWGGPSVTPGLDGKPIGRVFQRAKALGLKTSFDTCYDGSKVWYPRIEHALPHTDIVLTSLEEAREYTGQRTPEEIAGFFLHFGVEVAVVKLGPEGIYARRGSEELHVPGHRVENVVDTTGAGDAACAGFLFGYLRDWDLRRCVELANAVGALTVQAVGGANALQSLDQAMELVAAGV